MVGCRSRSRLPIACTEFSAATIGAKRGGCYELDTARRDCYWRRGRIVPHRLVLCRRLASSALDPSGDLAPGRRGTGDCSDRSSAISNLRGFRLRRRSTRPSLDGQYGQVGCRHVADGAVVAILTNAAFMKLHRVFVASYTVGWLVKLLIVAVAAGLFLR